MRLEGCRRDRKDEKEMVRARQWKFKCRERPNGHDVTSAGCVGFRIISVDVEMRNELPKCKNLHDAGTTNGNEKVAEKIDYSISGIDYLAKGALLC